MPVADAHAALMREDPERGARLAPGDKARVARALEVVRSTGQTLSAWQVQTTGGIAPRVRVRGAVLLPEREALYQRCDMRFERMIANGALAEVQRLLQRDLDPDLPVMRAIGVPELAEHVRGNIPLEEAAASAARATRRYAKRQYTWLRHQLPPDWARIQFENFDKNAIFERLFRSMGLT